MKNSMPYITMYEIVSPNSTFGFKAGLRVPCVGNGIEEVVALLFPLMLYELVVVEK